MRTLKFMSNLHTAQLQVAEQLCGVNSFVDNWNGLLPFEENASQTQLAAKAHLVCRLQQARPERPMHFDRTADRNFGQLI